MLHAFYEVFEWFFEICVMNLNSERTKPVRLWFPPVTPDISTHPNFVFLRKPDARFRLGLGCAEHIPLN